MLQFFKSKKENTAEKYSKKLNKINKNIQI